MARTELLSSLALKSSFESYTKAPLGKVSLTAFLRVAIRASRWLRRYSSSFSVKAAILCRSSDRRWLGGADERLRFLPIDQATVQSAKRVQVATDLDSQRIADAAGSHRLEAGKPDEALDLGR